MHIKDSCTGWSSCHIAIINPEIMSSTISIAVQHRLQYCQYQNSVLHVRKLSSLTTGNGGQQMASYLCYYLPPVHWLLQKRVLLSAQLLMWSHKKKKINAKLCEISQISSVSAICRRFNFLSSQNECKNICENIACFCEYCTESLCILFRFIWARSTIKKNQ